MADDEEQELPEGGAADGRPPAAAATATEFPPEQGHPERRDLAAELARTEDRYKRAVADLENYRKRMARDLGGLVAQARESVIRDWLEAVDSVERALRMDPPEVLANGLRAVLQQMEGILSREGVSRIEAVGEPFDPERHEAVAVRPMDGAPARTVVDALRSGFAIGDRVLRPAQVVVARGEEHDR